MIKIDSYLEAIHFQTEVTAIIEGEDDVDLGIPKMDVKKTAKKMKAAVNMKDPKGSIKKLQGMVPPGINKQTFNKIDKLLNEKFTDYSKFKRIASGVVKNSIDGVSPKMANYAGSFLAFSSMFAPKGKQNLSPDKNLKLNIKQFVTEARKFGEDYEQEEEKETSRIRVSDYADIAVAWVIITTSLSLAIGIGGGVYMFLKGAGAGLAIGLSIGLPGLLSIVGWGAVSIAFMWFVLFMMRGAG